MDKTNLINEIKKRIPLFLRNKIGYILNVQIRKRIPFTYDIVVTGLGKNGSELQPFSSRLLPYFSARLYQEVKLLNEAIGNYHAQRSLEIGCGYGRLTPWIADHSDQHYAIDPEITFLKDAKKLYPSISFYETKVQKLPFPNSYFDLCVSWTVLQHIPPKELSKAVAEIKRVCKLKSVIILAEQVGTTGGYSCWGHTYKEWKALFLPWKLIWSTKRKLENTTKGFQGSIMRFEGIN